MPNVLSFRTCSKTMPIPTYSYRKSLDHELQKGYCLNPRCRQSVDPEFLWECPHCHMPLLIGDRYRPLRLLRHNQGQYATDLVEVEDWTNGGPPQVMKVLSHRCSLTQASLAQEAVNLMWLDHPHIPKVQADGYFVVKVPYATMPLYCLVMESKAGEPLDQWLALHRPSLSQVLQWLFQLLDLLRHVHAVGLVHGDLKPANLLLQPGGQLALLDFGASVRMERQQLGHTSSFGYAAPEQVQGAALGAATDVFALGRTLVHLLTGQHPLDLLDDTGREVVWRSHAPIISPALADWVDQLMASEPSDRPDLSHPSMGLVFTMIERLAPHWELVLAGT